MMKVDHGDGVVTLYAQLHETLAKPARVETGQVIARAGASGRVAGPQLHFET